MSQDKNIRVEPQALREVAAQLRHSSAYIQHIHAELRQAVMELDLDCWPSGDAARLNASFSEAEIAGRRRVQARDDLSDTLMRAADAFERADTTAVQQLLGLVPAPRALPGSEPLHHTGLNARLPAAKNSVTKWNWRDALGDGLSWEADGFGWWAEAFERDHGRPPTAEDYAEFRLAWLLSGEGAVEWTEDDWVAFYYARQAGLEAWINELGYFPRAVNGQQVLAWVEAQNARAQALAPEIEPAPAPPVIEERPMRVVSGVGLNLRQAPGTGEVVLRRIPEGAEVIVHPDAPLQEGEHLWYRVTYTIPYASPDFRPPVSDISALGYTFRDGHPGIDYTYQGGDDQIYASAGGVVRFSGSMINRDGNYYDYGNYVIVEYPSDSVPQPMRDLPQYTEGDSVYILYAHLAETVTGLITVGTVLNQGDVIGVVGSTGNSTAPHLHMEVRIGEADLAGDRTDTDEESLERNRIDYFVNRNQGRLPAIDPAVIFSERITWTGWVAGERIDGTEQYLGNPEE